MGRQNLIGKTCAVVFFSFFACASAAQAQAIVEAGGTNPTLRSLGANIASICPGLPKTGTTDRDDLGRRCAAAVAAANGGQTAAARTALGQIAPDELIAQDAVISGSVRPQTSAITGRLAALGGFGSVGVQTAANNYARTTMFDSDDPQGLGSVTRSKRFDVFGTLSYGTGEQDTTSLQTGFDADSYSILAGADYAMSDQLIVGAALGYGKTELNFDADGGDLENNAWTLAAYVSTNRADGLYASGLAAYSIVDYDSSRRISYVEGSGTPVDRTASGSTDATQYEVSGQAGYSFQKGAWAYGPSIGVAYRKLEIDGFSETGAAGLDMTYGDQDSDSLQWSLGGDIAYTMSTGYGVVTPYARAAVVYESLADERTIDVLYRAVAGTLTPGPTIRVQTLSPDRTRFEVSGGVSAQLSGGFSAFFDAQTVVGQDDVSIFNFAIGLRREF